MMDTRQNSLLNKNAPAWLSRVQIRVVTEADLPALEWDGEYSHFRRLYLEVFRSTQEGKAIMWVAELMEVNIIGQLFVQLTSSRKELANGTSRAYFYGFRVKPKYQGHGVGTKLLRTAEEDLVQRNFRWATLNVGRDNPGARRLYERLGYHIVANEAGRWSYQDQDGNRHEVNEPAWRMEKLLDL
jgi:ribosomal protein S18 acetylase RimI-like enzyme